MTYAQTTVNELYAKFRRSGDDQMNARLRLDGPTLEQLKIAVIAYGDEYESWEEE